MTTPALARLRAPQLVALLALVAVVQLRTGAAMAQVPALCADAVTQADLNQCAARKFAEADTVLNRTYKALFAKLDDSGRHNLVAAEQAWIVFRDRECDLRSGNDTLHPEQNGTVLPLLIGECRADLTQKRTVDLQGQLKCPGGDLSCSP